MSVTTLFPFVAAEARSRTPSRVALPTVWQRLANRFRRALAIRRYRALLCGMSDATLRDLAIDRDDIDRVVRNHIDEAGAPCCGYPFADPGGR
jgi:uncharacterized protein YjiS (DUF1127 family)